MIEKGWTTFAGNDFRIGTVYKGRLVFGDGDGTVFVVLGGIAYKGHLVTAME